MLIAVFLGLIIGSYIAHKQSRYVNLLYVMYRFRDKNSFEDLYDFCDNEFIFEMLKGAKHAPKTYREFLLRHEKGREIAGEAFINLYLSLSKMILINNLIILAVGLIVFRSNFIIFLIIFLACHVVYQLYLYHYKEHKISFNAINIHNYIIRDKRVRAASKK